MSKGSNFLLNIGPTADGRIPVIMQQKLLDIGRWLEVNGEGIYSSKCYAFSEQEDIRYTQKDGSIYAFILRFPCGRITLDDVDFDPAFKAQLCLAFEPINPDDLKTEYAYCVKLTK